MTHDPLVSMALLGTNRSPVLPQAPDPALEECWGRIPVEDPAEAVLQALALVRTMNRAGVKSGEERVAVDACAAESSEILPARALDDLVRMLRGEFREILPEWLRLASESGQVVPGRVLPELLLESTQDHSLRAFVRTIAGEKGRWIARQRERLSWIHEDHVIQAGSWEEGSQDERIAWLRKTRPQAPEEAMAAILSTWAGEEAVMREVIARMIADHPLDSDEGWLEKEVLKDRRQEMRELAMISLGKLENSGFVKRARERIQEHVTIQQTPSGNKMSIEAPSGFKSSWAADGIKQKPPQGTGEKAWWLRQMTGMVPLEEWSELLGIDAGDLFAIPMESDWQEPLLLGWMDAARRFPDRALAEQFVPFLAKLEPWPTAAPHRITVISSIFEALPPGPRHGLLDDIAGILPPETILVMLMKFRDFSHPAVGARVLAVIDGAMGMPHSHLQRQQARTLALHIPRQGIRARLEHLAKLPELSTAAEEFAAALEFRESFTRHFKTP